MKQKIYLQQLFLGSSTFLIILHNVLSVFIQFFSEMLFSKAGTFAVFYGYPLRLLTKQSGDFFDHKELQTCHAIVNQFNRLTLNTH